MANPMNMKARRRRRRMGMGMRMRMRSKRKALITRKMRMAMKGGKIVMVRKL
jgi:hypothetical protein